jgi:hypothetical protein
MIEDPETSGNAFTVVLVVATFLTILWLGLKPPR